MGSGPPKETQKPKKKKEGSRKGWGLGTTSTTATAGGTTERTDSPKKRLKLNEGLKLK